MGDYSIPTIPQKKATESAGCDVEGAYYDWLGGGMSGRNSSRAVVFAYASRLEIGLTMGGAAESVGAHDCEPKTVTSLGDSR